MKCLPRTAGLEKVIASVVAIAIAPWTAREVHQEIWWERWTEEDEKGNFEIFFKIHILNFFIKLKGGDVARSHNDKLTYKGKCISYIVYLLSKSLVDYPALLIPSYCLDCLACTFHIDFSINKKCVNHVVILLAWERSSIHKALNCISIWHKEHVSYFIVYSKV